MDPHYGRCGCALGSFGLRACSFGAGSSDDLLAVRIVSSFFGLHLAELATREIIVPEGPRTIRERRLCIDLRAFIRGEPLTIVQKRVEIARYFTTLTSKRGVSSRNRDGGASLPC